MYELNTKTREKSCPGLTLTLGILSLYGTYIYKIEKKKKRAVIKICVKTDMPHIICGKTDFLIAVKSILR